jgi:monothiol glutaredoxin
MNVQEQIRKTVDENPVVLFMKGTQDFPQCGFSGKVVSMLRLCNASFMDVNVLASPEMREGIKEFSNWPTIPQLFVKGEFVGGCDIVTEMYESGDLQELLQCI